MSFESIEHKYHRACDLVGSEIVFDGRSTKEVDVARVRQGIRLFHEVLNSDKAKETWQIWWIIGKGHQCINELDDSIESFKNAQRIKPDEPDILRELGGTCLQASNWPSLLYYADIAYKFGPNDPGLLANLATAYMFNGKLKEAMATIEKCLVMTQDKKTKFIRDVICAVRDGVIPQPKTYDEVQKFWQKNLKT